MPATQPCVSLFRVSTRDRPERERVPFWCDFFGRHVIRTHVEKVVETGFDAHGTLLSAPGLRVHWSGYSTGVRMMRSRELISPNDDNVAILIDRKGTLAFSQGRRDVALERGGGVAVLQSEPASMAFPSARYMGVMVPVKALHALTHSVEDQAGHHIPPNTEALRLLIGYVDLLRREPLVSDTKLVTDVVVHIHDLMALTLGATRDAAAVAAGRGLRAARFKEIRRHVCENIAARDLSVQSVAAHYGLSPRYIQMLFEDDGTTFSAFVREHRLLQARSALRSPRHAGQSISSIAFAVGFTDLSHFNRSFRTKFGATPTEIRVGR